MTQPLGNCPDCGADEPFEQVHAGVCPDVAGECPEWACVGCGAGSCAITGSALSAVVHSAKSAACNTGLRNSVIIGFSLS